MIEIIQAEGDHTRWFLLACTDRGKEEEDRPPISLDSELAKAIVDTRVAARRLSSSIRSNQAKVASGHDTNRKTFFDYRAAARLKEAQGALDQLTTTKDLQERGDTPREIELIQQASLHGSFDGKHARERATQAQAQLYMLVVKAASPKPARIHFLVSGSRTSGIIVLW